MGDPKPHNNPGTKQFFGNYLIQNGIISQTQIDEAIRLQKEHRLLLGELGVRHGYFVQNDVDKVLAAQRESGRKFGELAIELGLITKTQLRDLLEAQSKNHFYLGEALIALGYLSQNDLYRYLADFKLATSAEHLKLADSLQDVFDHEVVEQFIKLVHEFFYNEGFVATATAVEKQLPPPNHYNVYSTQYSIKQRGFFQKRSYYSISMLMLDSWHRLIGNKDAVVDNTNRPSTEQSVMAKLTDLNELLCSRLRRLGYDCQHGPVQTIIPPFSHCLSIRYETSIEPIYVIYTKNL